MVYAGDFAVPVTEQIDLVIHKDGSLNAKGADVCDPCTVAGRTGKQSSCTFTGHRRYPSGFFSGRFSIGHGTGGLANLHGVGTFQSSNGVSGPFSGVYHFDPQLGWGRPSGTAVP